MNYMVYFTWGPSPRYFETFEEANKHYSFVRKLLRDPDTAKICKIVEI